MFTKPVQKTKLETEIDRLLTELNDQDTTSDDYATKLDHISKLHKMKEDEKPSRVSKDTLALIGANLAGIVLIISHEHANVITSKAMSLLIKAR